VDRDCSSFGGCRTRTALVSAIRSLHLDFRPQGVDTQGKSAPVQDRPGRYSSGRLDLPCVTTSKGNRSLTLSESGVHVVERGICGFIRVLRTMIVDVCTQDSTLHRIVAGAADGAGTSISTAVDRKSTRLNSSHLGISYAVFCLK